MSFGMGGTQVKKFNQQMMQLPYGCPNTPPGPLFITHSLLILRRSFSFSGKGHQVPPPIAGSVSLLLLKSRHLVVVFIEYFTPSP